MAVRPNVTIFADASCFHLTGKAGWGAWAKGDDRKSASWGGPLEFHEDVAVLELRALANMIEVLIENRYLVEADRAVMLQSDSTTALGLIKRHIPSSVESRHREGVAITNRKKPNPPGSDVELARIAKMLSGRMVILRHVRGHTQGEGRQWVNRLCDRLAKDGAKRGKVTRGIAA